MKKSIIIIAFATLMVASVFADTSLPVTNTTNVELILEKDPTYVIGITTGAFNQSSIDDNKPSQTKITNTTTIQLTREELKFKDATNNYYLSFFLYEYNAVDVTLTIDGNMKHTNYNSATEANKKNYEIPYYLTIAKGNDTIQTKSQGTHSFNETKLESNTDGKKEWKAEYTTATTQLGDYSWASLKLTIAPQTEDTLKGKVEGTFTSIVTVQVSART